MQYWCQTKNIPLDAASPAELTLFKSCNALASGASRAFVLTGKGTIKLLELFGRPNQAESLRRELERMLDEDDPIMDLTHEVHSFTMEGDVIINFIREPSSDTIFAVKQIVSVSRSRDVAEVPASRITSRSFICICIHSLDGDLTGNLFDVQFYFSRFCDVHDWQKMKHVLLNISFLQTLPTLILSRLCENVAKP